jgi:hypothetical protein
MKLIKSIIILGTVALFGSCSLDLEPISTPTELTEGKPSDTATAVLKDKAAAAAQLTNLYELFRGRQEYSHLDLLAEADAHSDNAYGGGDGAEPKPFEKNGVDPTDYILSRDWSCYLEDIAQSNVLINGVAQLHDAGKLSDAEYHSYKAQGEIFRAIRMFNMARLWGSFPVITTIAKSITYENIDEVYPTYYPPRSTQEECYKQILADLSDAEKYAPDFSSSDRTLMTKTVAQAMLAKVYAEKPVQDYAKVIEYAEKVRSAAGLALEPEYSTLFGWDAAKNDCVKRNTSEGILEVHWFNGSGNWESWMFGRCLEDYDYYFTWVKWITPSRDLIRDFTEEGDTTRLNQSVVYYSCTWSDYYPASHYPFMYKMRSGYNSLYMLRLADILLMEAEAYAYQGNISKSAELVNMVRERAKLKDLTSDKTANKEAMIEAVLHERRLELAFEGQRWFDLVRNGKVEEYMNTVNSRDSGRLKQVRAFDANTYLYPIPQTALDENVNLVQNPGY